MSQSFWAVEGEVIGAQDKIEVAGGGNNDMPIPAGTNVRAVIDDVAWKTSENEGTFINVKWKVTAPECYAGRVIFQKIHVRCSEFRHAKKWKAMDDSKLNGQRARFLRMLATIDTNAGGKLLASPEMPTDERMQMCLGGKEMSLGLDVWESDRDQNGQVIPNAIDYGRGNWIKSVAPKSEFKNMDKAAQEDAVAKTQEQYSRMLEQAGGQRQQRLTGGGAPSGGGQQQRPNPQPGNDFDAFDDDIPF